MAVMALTAGLLRSSSGSGSGDSELDSLGSAWLGRPACSARLGPARLTLLNRSRSCFSLKGISCLVTVIGLLHCRLFVQHSMSCSTSFVFVPGIVYVANSWEATMPSSVCMVPVDYYPSAAEQRGAGEPGDVTEVAAYRMLTKILHISLAAAASGKPWAFGGHSSGGVVVYRCMDHLASLITEPLAAAVAISSEGMKWLPAEEGLELSELFTRLAGRPPSMPIAAISFEGSLMPCDVEGWAQEWAEAAEPPNGTKPSLETWLTLDVAHGESLCGFSLCQL
ncbi:unnamed protein product [Polarella glacialis]|uniref:Uncharacterized protein n=1 Tax=Polarella glacialis TaxID=89957 RepID=A0A813HXD5_POLGL|nr:unnamed protein product [Polarella glacialis]